MVNILIIEDDREIADLVEVYLKTEGFQVHKFYQGLPGLACLANQKIDLAILDIMLPDISGLEIATKIRQDYHFPIIMLTAKDQAIDKVQGLTLGADDYVTKPFQPLELIARVKAQLRRVTTYNEDSQEPASEDILEYHGLVLNQRSYDCHLNEVKVELTLTEHKILWLLLANQGKVMSAEEIFLTVWGKKYYESSNNTVMVHIRHLRSKLAAISQKQEYIKTVWGVGYKIEN